MTESSGYDSNASGNSLTPLGSVPTTSSSPQSTLGQSPNNGYHLSQHHIRHNPAHVSENAQYNQHSLDHAPQRNVISSDLKDLVLGKQTGFLLLTMPPSTVKSNTKIPFSYIFFGVPSAAASSEPIKSESAFTWEEDKLA